MKTEEVEAYLEQVRQLDAEAEQEQLRNPSPFIVELRECSAKASQELIEAKRKPTKAEKTSCLTKNSKKSELCQPVLKSSKEI